MPRSVAFPALFLLATMACHPPPPRSTPNGEVPAAIVVDGKNLLLNGSVHYQATVFAIDVFVVALYLEKTTKDAAVAGSCEGPTELDFTWIYEVSRDDLVDPWRDAMRKNAGADLPALTARIDQLVAALRGAKKGDVWRFVYTPAVGMSVTMNGAEVVKLPGQDFCRLFVAGQVGANADETTCKGLLGG